MRNSSPKLVGLSTIGRLRSMMEMWCFAGFLPLPVLVAIDPARSADISCVYLGVINAWLVAELYRAWGLPESAASWCARMVATIIAISVNVALFIGFGFAAGVETHFPFPLMAVLSVMPAIGVMPTMLSTVSNHPYAAIVLSGFLIFVCKLAGCVVARLVYGPNMIAEGYVSADWRTAKLMITVFWSLSTLLSLGLLAVDYRRCIRKNREPLV
jgi:hypothetical protein